MGLFNVVGAIFYLVGTNTNLKELNGTFLCFGINSFIFSFENVRAFLLENLPWSGLLFIVISFLISAFYCFLGIFAIKGNKICLFLGTIFYFIDWVFLLLCYYIELVIIERSIIYLMIGVHLVISVFLIIAIIQYFKVIDLENLKTK